MAGTQSAGDDSPGLGRLFAPYAGEQPPRLACVCVNQRSLVAELDPATFTIVNLIAQQGATVQDLCALLQ
jgi:hypothetical protein